jgi:DNA-binding response OmpR family regulator
MAKILLVEDEHAIREAEPAYLRSAGHEVTEVADGAAALEQFVAVAPHAVVLDLSLPNVDGVELCRAIRQISTVPILMVTARTSEVDELLGLDVGADDYLKKPFNPRILVARVQALLRRAGHRSFGVGPFRIEPEQMRVLKHGEPITLTTTQFNIFYRMVSHVGAVLSRDQLLDAAHEYDSSRRVVFDRTIDAHIKAIRKRIEDDPSQPRYIQTVIGRGYRFME